MGELYSVLFICRQNMCRSPMAARLLCDLVAKTGDLSDWRIESAGTWSVEGAAATPRANQAMKQFGLELDEHRSRCVTSEMLENFHLILTMEKGQQEALGVEFPALRRRIFCLSAMIGQHWDLPDPPSGDLAEFVGIAMQIQGVLTRGLTMIKQLARGMESGDS
ncbi:MAG: arsenate reductase/protein-tyrosine-phosphatase family protein [Anaerolineae bacterium]